MKKVSGCEDAVSSVIGVVFMVGMTVFMASVVAVSVYGFSVEESAPQAKIMAVEAKGDMTAALKKNFIILKHRGGDVLFENETKIIITGKGCAYTGSTCVLGDMMATYEDLNGENFVNSYDWEIVEETSWDAGETITLYGSDGRDLDLFGDRRNTVDSKWKLKTGSDVVVTIVDIPTNQIIAATRITVKHP